jgi:hypothetical protein
MPPQHSTAFPRADLCLPAWQRRLVVAQQMRIAFSSALVTGLALLCALPLREGGTSFHQVNGEWVREARSGLEQYLPTPGQGGWLAVIVPAMWIAAGLATAAVGAGAINRRRMFGMRSVFLSWALLYVALILALPTTTFRIWAHGNVDYYFCEHVGLMGDSLIVMLALSMWRIHRLVRQQWAPPVWTIGLATMASLFVNHLWSGKSIGAMTSDLNYGILVFPTLVLFVPGVWLLGVFLNVWVARMIQSERTAWQSPEKR